MNDWLTNFLFSHTRKTQPDGRALYAYRCSEKKYFELIDLVKQAIKLNARNPYCSLKLPALFCLYASETFRLQHIDGIWTWDTIFNHLDIPTPPHTKISLWVEEGMRWWHRPVIRRQSGDRQFLVTIACEGGLPLNLLKNQTSINQFFRVVLEKYHLRRLYGDEYAEQIASEQAMLLPISLRQDVVFRLTGRLIAEIVELQKQVNDAANPVEALNTSNPAWRKRLPLRLEDETAEVLLNGLVQQSIKLSQDTRIRWRGWLRTSADSWQVEKTLHVPEYLSATQTLSWMGQQQLTIPRLRMMLHTPSRNDAVALLTLNQQEENNQTFAYRREWLHRSGVKCSGSSVSSPHQIYITSSEINQPLPIHNGEPWGELPWVFVETNNPKEWEWLTEGSACTRSEVALVLVRDGFTPTIANQGEYEMLGVISTLERILYRIKGEITFSSPVGDSYRIRCRADRDSDESFDLVGDMVNDVLNERPIFRGLPSIMISTTSGQRHRAIGKVQWRPLHEQGVWRDNEAGCRGRVWLRLMEADLNAERFRCQIDIVPKSFRIERTVGTSTRPGEYRLKGMSNASLSSCRDQAVEIQAGWDESKIGCPPLQNTAPEALRLLMYWSSIEQLELVLPYPQRGAIFQLAGKTLEHSSVVPLGRIGGLHLFLQDQSDNSRFVLDVQLQDSTLGFRQSLPTLKDGRLGFALEVERDRITSLLASTDKQDASVEIKVFCGQEYLAAVSVARFDVAMQPYYTKNCVSIGEKSLPRLGDAWDTRIQTEMIPLWNPMVEPITLMKSEKLQDTWEIPSNLENGPWWVIGRDGAWARFRPLLWSVRNDSINSIEGSYVGTNLSLKSAILEPEEGQRKSQLTELMVVLGKSPEHPDWPLIFDYIRLTHEFPPSALDILKALVAHPPALALALLKADDNTFDQLWLLSEQMPFSWSLIAVTVWGDAAQLYYGSLREALASVESAENIVWSTFKAFRERTTNRRESWKPLCDWIQEQLFLNKPTEGGSLLRLARMANGSYLKTLIPQSEQELQGRHAADEKWPESYELKRYFKSIENQYRYEKYANQFRPVRCAPFVAAHLSLQGIQPSPLLVYELRLIRAFDSKWFFEIYGIALALGLAAMPKEKN